MKTKHTKELNFRKESIVELNDNQLYSVNGGTSPIISLITRSSRPCLVTISITVPTEITE